MDVILYQNEINKNTVIIANKKYTFLNINNICNTNNWINNMRIEISFEWIDLIFKELRQSGKISYKEMRNFQKCLNVPIEEVIEFTIQDLTFKEIHNRIDSIRNRQ